MRQGFLKDCFATLAQRAALACDGTHFYGGWLQLLRLLDFHSLDALADQLSKVPVLEPFLEFGIMFELFAGLEEGPHVLEAGHHVARRQECQCPSHRVSLGQRWNGVG